MIGLARRRPRMKGGSISRLSAPDGTNFDNAVTCRRATGSPGKRGIEIGSLDEVIAGELLFRICERAIQHLGFPVDIAHRSCGGTWLEPIAANHSTRLRQCF